MLQQSDISGGWKPYGTAGRYMEGATTPPSRVMRKLPPLMDADVKATPSVRLCPPLCRMSPRAGRHPPSHQSTGAAAPTPRRSTGAAPPATLPRPEPPSTA
jgi:hypothetical protein